MWRFCPHKATRTKLASKSSFLIFAKSIFWYSKLLLKLSLGNIVKFFSIMLNFPWKEILQLVRWLKKCNQGLRLLIVSVCSDFVVSIGSDCVVCGWVVYFLWRNLSVITYIMIFIDYLHLFFFWLYRKETKLWI